MNEKPLSVLMTDLDDFKSINEQYGSNIGDALLVKIASRLRSCIRPHDSLGRFEDGKFLILLPGASHDISKMGRRAIAKCHSVQCRKRRQQMIGMTISAGTVSTDKFATANSDELLSIACTTLHKAHQLGPSSIVQATPENNK